jgi:hypothetical protein
LVILQNIYKITIKGGAVWEFLICLVLGSMVGILSIAAEKFEFMSRLFEALAGFIDF